MCTMESMLRSGSTAIVPAGAAGLIIDAAPTKHAASMLQIFPHRCVYIQQRSARKDLPAFPSVMVSLGSAVSRVTVCRPSLSSLSHSENLSKSASTNQRALWAA